MTAQAEWGDDDSSEGDDTSSDSDATAEEKDDEGSASEDAAGDDGDGEEYCEPGSDADDAGSGESVEALEGMILPEGAPAMAAPADGDITPCATSSSQSSTDSSDGDDSSSEASAPAEAGDAPALAPPAIAEPPADGERVNRTVRINAHCTLQVFKLGGRQKMIATCKHPGHGVCVLTRTVLPNKAPNKRGQGRCIGKMVAWCMACTDAVFPEGRHLKFTPYFEQRRAARSHFYTLEGADFFATQERPPWSDEEDSEPAEVP